MALLGNGVRLGSMNPGRTGFGVASVYGVSRSGNQSPGGLRNWWASEATYAPSPAIKGAVYSSIPDGYLAPGSWAIAPKAGGMASRNIIAGTGSVAATLISSTPMAASLSGAGQVTTAALSVVIQLSAALAGVGSLSGSAVGSLGLVAALGGVGQVTAALKVVSGLVASLAGTGSVSANLKGYANMEADILPYTDLSPQALSAAVWNSVLASYQQSGSTGAALYDASQGSGGGGSVTTYNSTRSVAGEARWLTGSTATRQFRLLGLDGTGEDLTGYTVTAYIAPSSGAVFSRSCTLVTAASGDVSFSLANQHWGYIAGKPFRLQFKAVNGGTTRYYPEDGPVLVSLETLVAE